MSFDLRKMMIQPEISPLKPQTCKVLCITPFKSTKKTITFEPETSPENNSYSCFISLNHGVCNSIVTFLASKVTYKIMFLRSGDQMFPIGHQLAAKQKVNFEPCLSGEVLIFQVF